MNFMFSSHTPCTVLDICDAERSSACWSAMVPQEHAKRGKKAERNVYRTPRRHLLPTLRLIRRGCHRMRKAISHTRKRGNGPGERTMHTCVFLCCQAPSVPDGFKKNDQNPGAYQEGGPETETIAKLAAPNAGKEPKA